VQLVEVGPCTMRASARSAASSGSRSSTSASNEQRPLPSAVRVCRSRRVETDGTFDFCTLATSRARRKRNLASGSRKRRTAMRSAVRLTRCSRAVTQIHESGLRKPGAESAHQPSTPPPRTTATTLRRHFQKVRRRESGQAEQTVIQSICPLGMNATFARGSRSRTSPHHTARHALEELLTPGRKSKPVHGGAARHEDEGRQEEPEVAAVRAKSRHAAAMAGKVADEDSDRDQRSWRRLTQRERVDHSRDR